MYDALFLGFNTYTFTIFYTYITIISLKKHLIKKFNYSFVNNTIEYNLYLIILFRSTY